MAQQKPSGKLTRVSGPMIVAGGMAGVGMGEIVRVGNIGLMGEVIRVQDDSVFAQVYEDTQGIMIGEPVTPSGTPLTIELGPGLLGNTYDGLLRSLEALQAQSGPFIARGHDAVAIDREKLWSFTPAAQAGQEAGPGDLLGTVPETPAIEHRILVPPKMRGRLASVAAPGEYPVTAAIATFEDGRELTMMQRWPVKEPRPFLRRLPCDQPFITGQRVLDCLFPIAQGGTAIVPGGFGTGKTVVEQMLAKYSNADIIVYVGCGERGNEMADVLSEFPELTDPRSGQSLMSRTILVVNTSNMPVAARDASVYTGVTLAEYYRDQGYNVALMADSTSRWAEALREISSRLEEMPGEEGYPTYLSARISEFYERAGRVVCCGNGAPQGRQGSLTLVGAVSPPGGDFSEPVTQSSLRVAGGLWALDPVLAYRRHYPAVNWNRCYSLYWNDLHPWFEAEAPPQWCEHRQAAMELLQKDAELQEVVQLVGPDALQDEERLVLEVAKLIREVFLQQNAFSDDDAFSSLEKTAGLLEALLAFNEVCERLIAGDTPLAQLLELPIREDLARLRETPPDAFAERCAVVLRDIRQMESASAESEGKQS